MKKNKLGPKDEATLNALRDRLLLTLRFFANAQEFKSGDRFMALVEQTAALKDLRSLRLLAREIDEMTIALAPHQREGLEALLHARLGVERQAERAVLREKVLAVLERGTIASAKERRRLEDYVEMLEATGDDPLEAEAVRELLRS